VPAARSTSYESACRCRSDSEEKPRAGHSVAFPRILSKHCSLVGSLKRWLAYSAIRACRLAIMSRRCRRSSPVLPRLSLRNCRIRRVPLANNFPRENSARNRLARTCADACRFVQWMGSKDDSLVRAAIAPQCYAYITAPLDARGRSDSEETRKVQNRHVSHHVVCRRRRKRLRYGISSPHPSWTMRKAGSRTLSI